MYILAAILPNERLNCLSFDPDSQFERTFLDYQIRVNATHKFLLIDLGPELQFLLKVKEDLS